MTDTIFYLTAWMEASHQRSDFAQDDMCEFAEWYHQKREQERQGPAPDRDELAMTMPEHNFPSITDKNVFYNICDHLEIEYNPSDPVSCIKASLEYDARVRYMYADAMLKARKVQPVTESKPDPDLKHIQNILDTCERLGCTPSELLKMNYMSELKK